MTQGELSLVDARGRKYLTAEERARFFAEVLGHASLDTTATGAQAREFVSRLWASGS